MRPVGIYVHVPFCTRRCDYCDFFVTVGRESDLAAYVDRIAEEILASGRAEDGPIPADTIYLGGGTPSLLAPEQVERLLGSCRSAFDLDAGAEVTLEANPEGIRPESLRGWLEAGVNRLSVGVQSVHDPTLKRRGRLHTGGEGLEAVRAAHEAGFDNVGADLIVGLPPAGGPLEVVEEARGAATALAGLRPEHVSLYLLETDKETPLMAAVREGRIALPSDDEAAEAWEGAAGILEEAGYEHYEISSFCLPGRRSRHNMKYWTGEPFLGFGPSAFSSAEGRLWSVPRDLDAFLRGRARRIDHSLGSAPAAAREALVLRLRLLEGVDLDAFDAERGTALAREIPAEVRDLLEAGCLKIERSLLSLTRRGLLLANEVFARIAAPPTHPAGAEAGAPPLP